MKTLSIAKQNKEEILEYVMHDSLALKDVYKKFMKAVINIIVHYC